MPTYKQVNTAYKDKDLLLWQKYKATKSPEARELLLKRFDSLIQSYVNKWAGPVPRDVLVNKAKLLAAKSFDTYDPNRGTALATHVTNNLAPLSRVVYSTQNTARLPENIVLKLHSYNSAMEDLTNRHGRTPTTEELHESLGWSIPELQRIHTYQRKDLTESVGGLNDSFFDNAEDKDDAALHAVYMSLTPEEKTLFEYTTGYGHHPKLSNPEICAKLGLTQAQLSYKRTLLIKRVSDLATRSRSIYAS